MAWSIDIDNWSTPEGATRIIKNTTTSGTYNIHAQLCFPDSLANSQPNLLQIATHGVFYDSRYWDSKLDPEKHSYVEAALKAGYSILTYDRLGVGESDHPDAYTVVQAPLELEILKQVTLMARNGTLYNIGRHVPGHNAPDKIVHVGHSFGSFLTSAFIATYPLLSDGAIITGYVLNKHFGDIGYTSWGVQYAATADPPYDRPSGYAVPSKQGIQAVFYGGQPGVAFTKEELDYGNAIKQPVPVGELASSYQLVGLPGPSFEGPIQYMMPEFDFFICGGDCRNTYSLEQLHATYPKASAIEVYIQPNTGHALPLHNNATAGFQASFDFLEKHGLGTGVATAN
jgi:pimeloyl-ACP methyl ester carboxylesterase